MEELHSALVSPRHVWWKPAGKQERIWVTVSFVWCMILFAMMPLWHIKGGQNPSGIRAKVDPIAFHKRVEQFVADYKIGDELGMPIVARRRVPTSICSVACGGIWRCSWRRARATRSTSRRPT
jgi:hypothetical protein